uniref:Uncharacterized protein n=1 Tax=Anguilla anguilla TaxID=7936 RepID=A0A0E9XUF1_ANGAN
MNNCRCTSRCNSFPMFFFNIRNVNLMVFSY